MSRIAILTAASALLFTAPAAFAHPGHEPAIGGHWTAADHLLVLGAMAVAALLPAAPFLIRTVRARLRSRD
jgi:hypothetical protein